jgi:pimeloyl-ACP methyl ester carboxylesterase
MLKDKLDSIRFIDTGHSSTLLCAFGGIADAVGIPRFEFFNVTKQLKVDKMYIKDLHQAWYQKGLKGATTDVKGTWRAIGEVSRYYRRVVMVGNSMGGFAALLFGGMLAVDKVLAFSPQVCITPEWRKANGETRWTKFMARVDRVEGTKDVRRTVRWAHTTDFKIWYSSDFDLDRKHVGLLRGMENVTLYPVKANGHNIVRHLRDTGELFGILEDACFD